MVEADICLSRLSTRLCVCVLSPVYSSWNPPQRHLLPGNSVEEERGPADKTVDEDGIMATPLLTFNSVCRKAEDGTFVC